MKERQSLIKSLKSINKTNFSSLALDVFAYQYKYNIFYRRYVDVLKKIKVGEEYTPSKIQEIPFLPIQFFKTFEIISASGWIPEKIYKSSATTGMTRSKHYVKDNTLYLAYAKRAFENVYGSLKDFTIFALLPGYLERGDSSLVAMADYFIKETESDLSGFYLNNLDELIDKIDLAKQKDCKILLLGVSFAIWNLAELDTDLSGVIVMETGGMKGIGPELPKKAFHELLKKKLNVKNIHSEYGMTELLSQAYSTGNTIFYPSKTMQVLISDVTDPLTFHNYGKSGIINIVDLVNIDSCAFIQTEDLGLLHDNNTFEILGRMDNSEIRGCNLLVSDL